VWFSLTTSSNGNVGVTPTRTAAEEGQETQQAADEEHRLRKRVSDEKQAAVEMKVKKYILGHSVVSIVLLSC
jgi:hypothetical protein